MEEAAWAHFLQEGKNKNDVLEPQYTPQDLCDVGSGVFPLLRGGQTRVRYVAGRLTARASLSLCPCWALQGLEYGGR